MLPVQCAWCESPAPDAKPPAPGLVSYGICEECLQQALAGFAPFQEGAALARPAEFARPCPGLTTVLPPPEE